MDLKNVKLAESLTLSNILSGRLSHLSQPREVLMILDGPSTKSPIAQSQNMNLSLLALKAMHDIFTINNEKVKVVYSTLNHLKSIKRGGFSNMNIFVLDDASEYRGGDTSYMTKELKHAHNSRLQGLPPLSFLAQVSKDLSKMSDSFNGAQIQTNITIVGAQNKHSLMEEQIQKIFQKNCDSNMISGLNVFSIVVDKTLLSNGVAQPQPALGVKTRSRAKHSIVDQSVLVRSIVEEQYLRQDLVDIMARQLEERGRQPGVQLKDCKLIDVVVQRCKGIANAKQDAVETDDQMIDNLMETISVLKESMIKVHQHLLQCSALEFDNILASGQATKKSAKTRKQLSTKDSLAFIEYLMALPVLPEAKALPKMLPKHAFSLLREFYVPLILQNITKESSAQFLDKEHVDNLTRFFDEKLSCLLNVNMGL